MCGRAQYSHITTTNHVERLWQLIKYTFLIRRTKLSVSRLIEVLLGEVCLNSQEGSQVHGLRLPWHAHNNCYWFLST